MRSHAPPGFSALYVRRLAFAARTVDGIIGQITPPILWILIVAVALDTALGDFNPNIDYYTFVAVGQITFLVPFVSMFSGMHVIVDKEFGILRNLLVAPVRRATIPIANAFAVLTIALIEVGILVSLAIARGADFHTPFVGALWFVGAVAFLSLGTYGIAEILSLRIGRQEAYGPLIPCGRRHAVVPVEGAVSARRVARGHQVRRVRASLDPCGRSDALRADARHGPRSEGDLGDGLARGDGKSEPCRPGRVRARHVGACRARLSQEGHDLIK